MVNEPVSLEKLQQHLKEKICFFALFGRFQKKQQQQQNFPSSDFLS